MASEPYLYRRENVEDENGNVVDTALFRVPNPNNGRQSSGSGGGRAVYGGSANGASRVAASAADWANAEYRGASAGGRVRQYIRSAAGRGAARNPVMRNNRYGI